MMTPEQLRELLQPPQLFGDRLRQRPAQNAQLLP
jgi:hypothetical protein